HALRFGPLAVSAPRRALHLLLFRRASRLSPGQRPARAHRCGQGGARRDAGLLHGGIGRRRFAAATMGSRVTKAERRPALRTLAVAAVPLALPGAALASPRIPRPTLRAPAGDECPARSAPAADSLVRAGRYWHASRVQPAVRGTRPVRADSLLV